MPLWQRIIDAFMEINWHCSQNKQALDSPVGWISIWPFPRCINVEIKLADGISLWQPQHKRAYGDIKQTVIAIRRRSWVAIALPTVYLPTLCLTTRCLSSLKCLDCCLKFSVNETWRPRRGAAVLSLPLRFWPNSSHLEENDAYTEETKWIPWCTKPSSTAMLQKIHPLPNVHHCMRN